MALSEKKHHTSRGQRKGLREHPLPSRSSSSCSRKSPAVPGHPVRVSRGSHRRGSSSAAWSSSPTSCPRCRFWTSLGRRGETSWWRRASTLICRFPSNRGAQDLIFIPTFSQAQGSPQHADGGTVGGSARIRVVRLSVPAADRSLSWTSSRSSPWTGLFVGVGADCVKSTPHTSSFSRVCPHS